MIRCIAYSEVLGRMCGQFAYIFDRERGGWVCAEHHNDTPTEDLAEATVTLAIRTQATLIEHQLSLRKIFLARSSRCLPQSNGVKFPIDGLTPFASGERAPAREASVRNESGVASSTPAPAANPNAAAFSQVHVSGGGRW